MIKLIQEIREEWPWAVSLWFAPIGLGFTLTMIYIETIYKIIAKHVIGILPNNELGTILFTIIFFHPFVIIYLGFHFTRKNIKKYSIKQQNLREVKHE